jgi:hypothetical protein
MNRKNARLIRSAIVAARRGGMHAVGMIYGSGHDRLWMAAYTRTLKRLPQKERR